MSKTLTLQEIATAVNGRLVGDASLSVTRLVHPADVKAASDLALAMDASLLPLLKDSACMAAVVAGKDEDSAFIKNRVFVERPRLAIARLTALFAEPIAAFKGIHPTAIVEVGAQIGKNTSIGAYAYIGAGAVIGDDSFIHPQTYIGEKATIGANALIYSGVRIGAGTIIGKNAIIHFNTSIGADGFSFVTPQMGSVEAAKAGDNKIVSAKNTELIRIASLAPVIIGDDVEIGANSCIDRGTVASTRVGNGTKIDNQVQIGHNVTIGENCMICGRAGIAGSAKIGNRVVLGGAVGVADHVTIGDDAMVMAMSAAGGNVPSRSIVGGIPAVPREKAIENILNLGRLKQFFKKIEQLAQRIDILEKLSKND